jgi:hypothetical protein
VGLDVFIFKKEAAVIAQLSEIDGRRRVILKAARSKGETATAEIRPEWKWS